MTIAKMKVSALVFDPIPAASAPANSLYSDSGNAGTFTNKAPGGTPVPVGESVASALIKVMQNLSGATILAGKPVSKKSDGSIVAGDSDAADGQQLIGISLEEILDTETGNVALFGQNIPNAVSGLGFAPGDEVYLSETGGYTNDHGSFTGDNDSIFKIGIADCPAGNASGTATDLILFPEVLSRPL